MTAIEKLEQLRHDLPGLANPKQPRHYAEEIVSLPTREARTAALALVPERYRRIVKFYVASEFAKRHGQPLPDLET